ncbi:MAG: WcaF family extracellular polysaccharide biosynthesis acetyltransferase [Cyclobacteriaceae bacterium]
MLKTTLDQYENSWYQPGKSALVQLLWYFVNSLFFQSSLFPINGLKTGLLRMFGAQVGQGVIIKPAVNIKYPWRLSIGDYVWIGEKVWIDNLVEVHIGSNTCISQGAMLLTGSHNYKRPTFDLMTGSILLEEGVWIGAQSVVCPGVRCGSHSVLSVSSVATTNLKAYKIYQGNPASIKRDRVSQDRILTVDNKIPQTSVAPDIGLPIQCS